jgi:hypothetical protein
MLLSSAGVQYFVVDKNIFLLLNLSFSGKNLFFSIVWYLN